MRLPGSAMRMRPLALGDACVRAGDWSGALTAYVRAVGEAARRGPSAGPGVGCRAAYRHAPEDVGRAILLGPEALIMADIVLTITVDRTFDSAMTLGLIVLVRTFLSGSLQIELEASLPWHRDSMGKRRAAASVGWTSVSEAAP